MKKLLLLFLLFPGLIISQTLVETVNIPSGTVWNSAYGLVAANGKYWVSSGSSSAAKKIYGLDASGNQTDEITINYYTMGYSQGLAHDGTNFWYVGYRSARYDLYKVTPAGEVLDSIICSTINGGTSWYIGGAAWDGSSLWVSVYYPNAQAGIYKINTTTKQLVDTFFLPAGQLQPTGLTVKGDTLYSANDGFEGVDKIYAFNIATGDTFYSFNPPEKPGVRQNPRGLAWDGQYFWLLAEPVNASSGRQLFKYDLAGNGTPGISLLNSSLNFGNVQIDSSLTLTASINNYGTADLIIDSVVVDNNVFQVDNVFPISISPGNTKDILVQFTPLNNTTYNGSLKLYHNFKAVPYSTITVSGKGVYTSSYITFNNSTLNFGDKRVNSTSYIEVIVRNLGSQILSVDSVKVNNERFLVADFTGPALIDTSGVVSFKVWFYPVAIQPYSGEVTVYSDAGNGAVKILPAMANGVSFDPALGNIIWQGSIPANPNTSYQDYSVKVIKKIQDINNDGIEDIIATTDNYWIIAFNGNSSNSSDILWKFSTYLASTNAGSVEWVQNLQMADVNQDGMEDIIAGTGGGNESVYAINGKNGQMIWEFGLPATYDDGDIMGVDVKRDWTGDGIHDVLVSASGNESSGAGRFSVYLVNGANGQQIWRIDQSAQQKLKYDVTSTTLGGAFGTRVGSSYEVVGFNKQGTIIWSFPPAGTPWKVGEIQDLSGDGHTDVIAGTINGQVVAISSDAGIQIWTASIGNVFIEDFRVIKDVNGNGVQDILVSGISPSAYVLEGLNGQMIWGQPVNGNILGIGELPDMTGDAISEAGVSDLGNYVTIMNGLTGALVFSYYMGPGSDGAAEMVSAMGDIDGVGAGEFVAGSRGGRIIAFSGGTVGIIPVEMTSFTASVNGNQVTLNWTAATELNNKGFAVERRTDNSSYEQLHFIDGRGTASEPKSYSFADNDLPYGVYYYRIKQVDLDGTANYSKEVTAEIGLPVRYSLEQNYPNPFNPSTSIRYAIPYDGAVSLKIYNSVGEEIVTLVNKVQQAGNYNIQWNGKNSANISVPSGVYFYRIETERFTSSKKMLLLK